MSRALPNHLKHGARTERKMRRRVKRGDCPTKMTMRVAGPYALRLTRPRRILALPRRAPARFQSRLRRYLDAPPTRSRDARTDASSMRSDAPTRLLDAPDALSTLPRSSSLSLIPSPPHSLACLLDALRRASSTRPNALSTRSDGRAPDASSRFLSLSYPLLSSFSRLLSPSPPGIIR